MALSLEQLPPGNSRHDVALTVLRRGPVTRRQIGKLVQLSQARVTTHTRWLIDRDLLRVHRMRLPHADRPVEQLSLNSQKGTGLALMLSGSSVSAEIVALDATSLAAVRFALPQPTRASLASGITRAVTWAHEQAAALSRMLDTVCLGVDGYVGLHTGLVVYSVNGVLDWQPCDLQKVLRVFQDAQPSDTRSFFAWPLIMCKTRGYAEGAGVYHRIGYFEFRDRHFHHGKLDYGSVTRGYLGIDGGALHQPVLSDESVCYCGHRGCLAHALERGDPVAADLLAGKLVDFAKREQIQHVALDWPGMKDILVAAFGAAGLQAVCCGEHAEQIAAQGLRGLSAEVTAQAVIARMNKPARRRMTV